MFSVVKTLVKTLQAAPYKAPKDDEKKNKDFEVRSYEAVKWVSTKVKKISHKEATSEGFKRLFNYIGGENESKTAVEMTVPVTVRVDPGEGPACESTFTVSFYVPEEHQENPPLPTNKDVFIESRPAMTVYARTFGGFSSDEDWIDQSKQLMASIGDESRFDSSFFFTANYNSPFRLMGRTNDVWLVKKD